MRTCPNPACAEINLPSATHCSTCGKNLLPVYIRRKPLQIAAAK